MEPIVPDGISQFQGKVTCVRGRDVWLMVGRRKADSYHRD